jgi:nitrogen fixation/metabolism regulation signal transduction histidine kinase
VAAMMLAMLTLAKERIVSSMRSTVLRGRTLITILATIITLMTIMMTIIFALQFADRVMHPRPMPQSPCVVVPGPTSQAATRL